MIPQETIDAVFEAARIEDVVGDFVTLKRRGANLVACCPFHNEKTPSFYVSPAKGIYKCFGCGKAGTAVGFVMEHEHCSWTDAVRYLAKRFNIDIVEEEESAEEIAKRQRRESLLLVSEFAQKFYADQLKSGDGRAVGYAYFRSRGLEDSTIEHFGLGWAPAGRTAFFDAAVAAGYKPEYIFDAGLAVRREDGSIADKFHERAMFPIYSVSGRCVAFSGRTLRSDNPAKYVNTQDTEIYHKKENLLGIFHAKHEISRLHKCILVEGNVDMTTMHQLGITNVVASCGTALTVEQIRLIGRFTAPDNNVTIMYDGDSAGIHAALKGINLILAQGLNVKVVLLPDGDDPDSFCRKHNLEEVKAFLDGNEKDFIEFKSDLLLSEAGRDPLKKATLINDIADTIAVIPDAVKRSVYVEMCAEKFGIESGILFERIGRTRESNLTQERLEAQRQKNQAERAARYAVPQPQPGYEMAEPAAEPSVQDENPTLAPAERELLTFLMTHGCEPLDFESDSEYYSGSEEDKPTVADFIRASLEADGSSFDNTPLRNTYDAYMKQYDEGLEQERIVLNLLNSEDRTVASVAATLSSEKYVLSVESFRAAMTTIPSWLVKQVPRALLYYSERRLQDQMDRLRRSLADPETDVEAAMKKIITLRSVQRRVNAKLGRDKNS